MLVQEILHNSSHFTKMCHHQETKSLSLQFLSFRTCYKQSHLSQPKTDLIGTILCKVSEIANQVKVQKMVNQLAKSMKERHQALLPRKVKASFSPTVNLR